MAEIKKTQQVLCPRIPLIRGGFKMIEISNDPKLTRRRPGPNSEYSTRRQLYLMVIERIGDRGICVLVLNFDPSASV